MAIKTISQFPSGTPTNDDYILFEQNGEGKSATIANAVNTCSLSYEEIMASTDLTNKVASASAVQTIDANKFSIIYKNYEWKITHTFKITTRSIGLIYTDDGALYCYVIWDKSNISLTHISGSNTMTATIDNGNVSITLINSRALIVAGC